MQFWSPILYRQGHQCLNCTHTMGGLYKCQVCIIWSMCPRVCAGNDTTESGKLELVQLAVHSPGHADSQGLYDYTLNFMLDPKWKGTFTCMWIYIRVQYNDPRSVVYVVWQHYETHLSQLYLQWAKGLNYCTLHEYWESTSVLFIEPNCMGLHATQVQLRMWVP